MFLFYGYQKFSGSTEKAIWEHHYFLDHWQYFFDAFNSLPFAAMLFGIALWRDCRWAQLLLLSAMLHMLCDLPLHHDDGHRHFLPISTWRFASPVSYWDPRHFGLIVAPIEAILAIISLIFVLRSGEKPAKRIAVLTLGVYVAAFVAAAAYFFTR